MKKEGERLWSIAPRRAANGGKKSGADSQSVAVNLSALHEIEDHLQPAMQYDYDVRSCTIAELLRGDSPPFVVPEFQRPYSWTPAEIEALFEDVLEERHASESRATRYFIGAIVLVPRDGALLVIDGQQRLATISIVLAALREYMMQNGLPEDAEVLAQGLATKQLGQGRRPRLELQSDDAAAYRDAIERPGTIDERKKPLHRVHRAALAVRSELVSRIARVPGDGRGVVARMAQRFFSEIELVRIEAPNEGSAYRLFEALNDRGRSLTAADLIKNKIFSCATGNLNSVREHWSAIQRTIDDDEVLGFLRHFWIAFRGPVRRNDLYDAYDQEVANQTPEGVARLANDLAKAALVYRGLVAPRRIEKGDVLEPVSERLVRLSLLRAKSGRSLVLAFAQRWPTHLDGVVAMIEAASVRHGLACQRNPNQLDAAYNGICHALRQVDAADADRALEVVRENLTRWMPTDEEFQEALVNARVRTNAPGWRVLLVALEEHSSQGEIRVPGPADVHLEHVLPQTPSKECLDEAGLSIDAANDLAYRLGNLTLLLGKKNISASNAPFSIKRGILLSSQIRMNAAIAANKEWAEGQIEARTRELADAACRVWPWPPSLGRTAPMRRKTLPPSRSKVRHEPGQLAIPVTSDPRQNASRLDPTLTFESTVWIPRILWALDAASARGLGAITPSEIARLLERELEMTVQSTNTARAFRDLRTSNPIAMTWWEQRNGKYVITAQGREVLSELRAGRRPTRRSKNERRESIRPLAKAASLSAQSTKRRKAK